MPRLKRLSLKQKKFLSYYLKTGNSTESALQAYNVKSRRNAKVLAYQTLDQPIVQDALTNALKKNNVTLEGQTDRLKEIANDWQPDKVSSDTVLKANIELLKLLKAYPDRVQKHESKKTILNLNSKNFDDLIKLHKQSSKEIEDIIGS